MSYSSIKKSIYLSTKPLRDRAQLQDVENGYRMQFVSSVMPSDLALMQEMASWGVVCKT